MSLKLYFTKYEPGLDTTYREGGTYEVVSRMMHNPRIIASNNGAATFLLTVEETGFSTHIVESKPMSSKMTVALLFPATEYGVFLR